MRSLSLTVIFVAALCAVMVTTDVMAYHHPGLGRFMQRDPHGTSLTSHSKRIAGNMLPNTQGYIPRTTQPQRSFIAISSEFQIGSQSTGIQAFGASLRTETQQRVHAQYTDGMNLYGAYRSMPQRYVDPSGLYVINKSDTSHWVYISGAGGGWQQIGPGATVYGDTDMAAPRFSHHWGGPGNYKGYKVIDCMDIIITGTSPGPYYFEAQYSSDNLLLSRGNSFLRKCICSSSTAAWAFQYKNGGIVPISSVAGGGNNPPTYP